MCPGVRSMSNARFIEMAQSLIPELIKKENFPVSKFEGAFGRGDELVVDFGHNHAAYFEMNLECMGSLADAPALLHLKFCETKGELKEEKEEYNGWIGKGWIQEQWLHVNEFPCRISLPERYAFRFVKIKIEDTSPKYKVVFQKIKRTCVSSVDEKSVDIIQCEDELLKAIDKVSIRTLANCMQTVFEDGPKRDRRLWLGDLRLQALANYKTFHNYNLVKRCLYLFGGLRNEQGMVPACVFEKPKPAMDNSFLLDYAVFFIPTLVEYYRYAQDEETLRELAPVALRQMELALEYVDDSGVISLEGKEKDGSGYYGFIDWNDKLDKQCAMQGVLLYCLKYAEELCLLIDNKQKLWQCRNMYTKLLSAAVHEFWEEEKGVFVSGPARQISMASQVWMILGGAVSGNQGMNALEKASIRNIKMVTPYMHHFYVTALLKCGERKKAAEYIRSYWGGMIQRGADTFWELYDPENEKESPYGDVRVNSYCHAWSCTPAYLLRVENLSGSEE